MSEKAIEVKRGELVENIIRADIAVTDINGKLLYYLGDAYKYTYMRSCSKPIQALVPLKAGIAEKFKLSDKELAVMCASHSGEPFHVEAVRSILKRIGLDESYLQCGPAYSFSNNKVTEEYIRQGVPPLPVINNCSGKHSAMLALCVLENFSKSDYFLPEHPVQQRILREISAFSHYPVEKITIGIDGCGVPVFAMPLYNIARAYADFSCLPSKGGTSLDADRLCRVMTQNPEMIAGTGAFTTELMRAAKGSLIAKEGADGVYCMGIREKGWGIAIKCEDGNLQHISCIAMSVLEQLSLLNQEQAVALARFKVKDNFNCRNEVIGSVYPAFKLQKAD